MTIKLKKAERKQAKLRLALTGVSGSGKTLGALTIAKELGGKIACVDTERGTASLYSDVVDFDVVDLLPPFSPERYIEHIKEIESLGYNVLIIDSITPEWSGSGGCLEIIEDLAKARYRGNSWSAWSDVTPRHRAFFDAILYSNMHIIATVRSKTDTAQQEVGGKKTVVKLGMKPEQREGFEYEFTCVLDLVHDGHYAVKSKGKKGLLEGDPRPITSETGKDILAWLNTGAAHVVSSEDEFVRKIALTESLEQLKSVYKQAVQTCGSTESVVAAKNKRKLALESVETGADAIASLINGE